MGPRFGGMARPTEEIGLNRAVPAPTLVGRPKVRDPVSSAGASISP